MIAPVKSDSSYMLRFGQMKSPKDYLYSISIHPYWVIPLFGHFHVKSYRLLTIKDNAILEILKILNNYIYL